MSNSKFTWNNAEVNKLVNNVNKRMLGFGYKIANIAKSGAPHLTGALINSIHVNHDTENSIMIVAGGSIAGKKVDYARKREYENKAHPNTRFYMTNAFKWGEQNIMEYFKGVAG